MDSQRTTRTALLIVPRTFYAYPEMLATELSEAGFDVTIANDEYPDNFVGKIMGKIKLSALLSAITLWHMRRKYTRGKAYNIVIIIKGRGISVALIDEFKKGAATVVGCHFDSFTYNSTPLAWCRSVKRFCTFDYDDAEKFGLPLLELFSLLSPNEPAAARCYDISTIFRNHTDRLKYIDDILRHLRPERVFLYIYEQNIVMFIRNFLAHPLLYLKYRRHIHRRYLSYDKYCAALKHSDFTLDFAHPMQTGITMRCFEALSVGTKIITNNSNTLRNQNFSDHNTIVYNLRGDAASFRLKFNALRGSIVPEYRRSFRIFLRELLGSDELV